MPSRFLLHPLLTNRRSRLIFIIFSLVSVPIGVACWMQVNYTLKLAGINLNGPPLVDFPGLRFVLSASFRLGLILLTALVTSAFTAWYVVGPVRRIEDWLRDWNDDINPFPLLVRKYDKFSYLASLLNALYDKANRPSQN